jgi:hypothetical protein
MPVYLPVMSWLVAVSFPGLLMLGTVGLQRLETLLQGDRPTAADLLARIEQLARVARERTAPVPPKPRDGAGTRTDPISLVLADEPGLPTRLCARAHANP